MEHLARVGVAIATGLLLLPRPAAAQIGASTASIAGVVKDPSGAVLPGVTVEASSPVLIEKVRSTVTDDQGQYQIVGLQSGTYSIMFTLAGFSGLKRDGIELSPNFTATVNIELKVGGIEETLTVSGQSPLVDTRNVTNQKVVSKTLIDAVPTAKSILSIAALVPAATIPASAQDVGGSKGETTVRMSVHGAKPNDQRQMIDGMSYNSMFAGGTGRGFYANPLEMQDLVIDSGRAGSAEYALGGTMVNSVPRDGGDRFGGTLFTALMGHQLQSNNLTSDLVARGLTSVNGIRQMYDFNGAVGGPIVHDRLWFFTAQRWNGLTKRTANLFVDANAKAPNLPNNFLFKPDLSQPVEPVDRIHSHTVRLTWQATGKDKINVFNDTQRNSADSQGAGLDSGTTAREAVRPFCAQPSVTQGSWTRPQNNRLLFEGGVSFLSSGYYSLGSDLFMSDFTPCGEYQPDKISITDTALSLTYGGEGLRQKAKILLSNMRWSTTFTDKMTYHYGNTVVELLHLGVAHTWGDLVVYLPESKVMFASDVAFFSITPFAHQGHVTQWLEVVDKILAMDVETIIPGHGPIGGKKELAEMAEYFRILKREARKRFDAGMSPGKAAADIKMGKFDNWIGAERNLLNTFRLYCEFDGTLTPMLDLDRMGRATEEYNAIQKLRQPRA